MSLGCFTESTSIAQLSQLFLSFSMDIRSYFSSSSKPSTSSNSDSSSEEERDIPPSKKPCISTHDSEHSKKQSKYCTISTSSSSYSNSRKVGKKTSLGLSMMLIVKVHSVNCARLCSLS